MSERYRVVGRLGGGGMADVYDAIDSETGRRVAVKVLRGVDNPLDARRFAAEVRTTARLAHPCIVTLLDTGEHEGAPYLVMERIDGGSLADRVRQGPMPAQDVARVGAQVAAALAHAHEGGVVHRDVKPANVLLDSAGQAKLADFGIAISATATRLTVSGSVAGSAAYIAPEQVLGEGVGPGADIYALGLVLLECLMGRPVYTGTAVEAALARLTRDPEIPQELPAEWATLLRRMTAGRPQSRPSADAAAQTLAELATLEIVPACYAAPYVCPDAPTDPGTLVAPRPVAARRAGSRAVALLGSTIAGVFLAGVGALALPAMHAPSLQLASIDAWAPAPAPDASAVADSKTLDEDRIIAELRRWAAGRDRAAPAPATVETRAPNRRRPVRVATPVAAAPALPPRATNTATTTTRAEAPPALQVPRPTSSSAPEVPSVSVRTNAPLPVPTVTKPVADSVDTTTSTVAKTKSKAPGKVKGTARALLDVRALRAEKRRR